jgi:hypothetical protein
MTACIITGLAFIAIAVGICLLVIGFAMFLDKTDPFRK